MSDQIIGLHEWLRTPSGQYLLAWERAQYDRAVADIFGFNALQLGLPELDTLQANRMPHRWLVQSDADAARSPVGAQARTALVTDVVALPFAAASLDLVVLPHALELARDPHAALREVERVLVPEGRVVICGFNPAGLWGMRQRRARLAQRLGLGELFLPDVEEMIGHRRLRDWLRLLNFEVESSQFGCYRPAMRNRVWLERCAWMDAAGARWWPILGSVYFLVAVKRVHGVRLLGPAWKVAAKVAGAPASIARQVRDARSGASNTLKLDNPIEFH